MDDRAKRRVFDILEQAGEDDRLSLWCDGFLLVLIALNTLAVILETVPSFAAGYEPFFFWFEVVSVVIFTIEYGLRFWSCTIRERFRAPVRGRLRFMTTPLALVDLVAILPFYLPMLIRIDFRVLRVLRFVRLFRLLKMSRYLRSLRMFGTVVHEKKEELVIAIGMVLVILLFASSGMYALEHNAQPDAFASIPAAMWWGIATLTTVGYGDIYPITPLGKVLGSVIALLGVGLFALPAGILASGFNDVMQRRKIQMPRTCPHCGAVIGEESKVLDA
jgi:voltage-gated potassium channel